MVLKEASPRRMPSEFREMVDRCLRPIPSERPSLAELRVVISESLGTPGLGEQLSEIPEETRAAVRV
jgi:hypothetical protein